MEMTGQLLSPVALPKGQNPGTNWKKRLGGLENRSGRFGEETFPDTAKTQTQDRPVGSVVAIRTEPSFKPRSARVQNLLVVRKGFSLGFCCAF
jgi:hypothetical protein